MQESPPRLRDVSECRKCHWDNDPPVLLRCAHFGNDDLYLMDWQHEARIQGNAVIRRYEVWLAAWEGKDEKVECADDYESALALFAAFEKQLLESAAL